MFCCRTPCYTCIFTYYIYRSFTHSLFLVCKIHNLCLWLKFHVYTKLLLLFVTFMIKIPCLHKITVIVCYYSKFVIPGKQIIRKLLQKTATPYCGINLNIYLGKNWKFLSCIETYWIVGRLIWNKECNTLFCIPISNNYFLTQIRLCWSVLGLFNTTYVWGLFK
jgi:hypothetical protein